MQVPGHDHPGAIPPMPRLGAPGAAPDAEPRNAGQSHEVAAQGKVVDEHEGMAGRRLGQPRHGLADARAAPGGPRGIRIGGEIVLVRAPYPRLRRPRRRPLRPHRIGAEAVIVEEKQGGDDAPGLLGPDDVGILRGHHAETAAGLDHRLVLGHAARSIRTVTPELVVPGHPEDPREPLGRGAQTELDEGHRLGDVAGENQPVMGPRAPVREGLAVGAVAEMQVAEGVELHRSAGSLGTNVPPAAS